MKRFFSISTLTMLAQVIREFFLLYGQWERMTFLHILVLSQSRTQTLSLLYLNSFGSFLFSRDKEENHYHFLKACHDLDTVFSILPLDSILTFSFIYEVYYIC